jgi:hypothetical protein
MMFGPAHRSSDGAGAGGKRQQSKQHNQPGLSDRREQPGSHRAAERNGKNGKGKREDSAHGQKPPVMDQDPYHDISPQPD